MHDDLTHCALPANDAPLEIAWGRVSWASFDVRTSQRAQLVDITGRVADEVKRAGIAVGVCHVFVPHTTAGVTINEGADPAVARDIESRLEHLVPNKAGYRHAEGNSDSHIKTVLVGPSCVAPVRDGRLALGSWKAIFLCEWDGPRTRRIEVAVSALR
jgi:secondary thiamine-phosphate synthase enzyme